MAKNKGHKSDSGYGDFHSLGDPGEQLGTTSMEAIITLPIGNMVNEHGKKLAKPTRVDYSKLLSSTYAILIVLVGILFPMTEALHDEWHMTIYNMIYIVYTLSVSCICIIYLHWILHREHHRHLKARKHHHHTSSRRSSSTANHLQRRRSSAVTDFRIRETRQGILIEEDTSDSSESDRVEKPKHYRNRSSKFSTGTNHQSTAESNHSPMYAKGGSKTSANGGISAKLVFGSTNNLSGHVGGSQHFIGSASPASYDIDHNGNRRWPNDDDDDDKLSDFTHEEYQESSEHVWIDLSKLGGVFSHEGSSLYLRMGELIFAIANVIYIALEIEYQLNPKTAACSGTFSWTFYFRLAFILLQTFFLFKNSSMHTTEQGALVRFSLMHLIATNFSVWLRTLCNEIMNEYYHMSHYTLLAAAEDSNSSATDDFCSNTILSRTLPYLFPFVLEYSLIAMGTLAIMYAEVDTEHDERTDALRGLKNLFKVQALDKSSGSDVDSIASGDSLFQTLTKSHRGLFAGIIVLAGGFIAVLMFYLGPSDTQAVIYLVTDCSLHSLMLIGTVMALIQIHELSYIAKPVSVDDVLLIVSMCGAVLYELSIQMASGNYISNYSDSSDNHPPAAPGNHSLMHFVVSAVASDDQSTPAQKPLSTEILRLSSSIIACMQSVLQLMLSLSALRRYPSKHRHLARMPGRGVVTFLIISNVTVWILRSCLIKAMSPATQINYYGTITWLLLLNIGLPLLLFYRFHSSVCLADVWHTAYTSPFHAATHDHSDRGPKPIHGSNAAMSAHGSGPISSGAQASGVSTLIKAYSMSHLTPPRTSRSSVSRSSTAYGRVSAIPSGVTRLPHIDDVEDVEEIEDAFESTSSSSNMRF